MGGTARALAPVVDRIASRVQASGLQVVCKVPGLLVLASASLAAQVLPSGGGVILGAVYSQAAGAVSLAVDTGLVL